MIGWILVGFLTLEVIFHFILRRIEHKRISNNKKGVKDNGIS